VSIEEIIRQIVREELERAFREFRCQPEADQPVTVTVREAAHMLGLSPSQAYELVHRGIIPVVRLGPRSTRVPVAALKQRLNELAEAGSNPVEEAIKRREVWSRRKSERP